MRMRLWRFLASTSELTVLCSSFDMTLIGKWNCKYNVSAVHIGQSAVILLLVSSISIPQTNHAIIVAGYDSVYLPKAEHDHYLVEEKRWNNRRVKTVKKMFLLQILNKSIKIYSTDAQPYFGSSRILPINTTQIIIFDMEWEKTSRASKINVTCINSFFI